MKMKDFEGNEVAVFHYDGEKVKKKNGILISIDNGFLTIRTNYGDNDPKIISLPKEKIIRIRIFEDDEKINEIIMEDKNGKE